MQIIVKKFGGTSLGSIEKIKKIAKRIADEKDSITQIVVVVSAMGETTNQLFDLAYLISEKPCQRELDMLLTAGERISMSLLSLALNENGISSISFTGSQSGIITDNKHGNARIQNVSAFRIRDELNKGKVVIVAGFQGVSGQKEVTTLGRGGSDTTAVALASYLKAIKCEIFTDVDGIFTADPRIVDQATKIEQLDSDLMLALSTSGASVLHVRAVEFAITYGVAIEVKSSFNNNTGTQIYRIKEMEEKKIQAITKYSPLTSYRFKGEILSFSKLLNLLEKSYIEIFNYEIFSHELLIILQDKSDSNKIVDIISNFGILELIDMKENLSAITLVGVKLWNNTKLIVRISQLLQENQVEIIRIYHSHASITLLVDVQNEHKTVNLLHDKLIQRIK